MTQTLGLAMAISGDLMRKALKRHWLPELARLGFAGNTSTFQRLEPDAQDLLSLQYWKYGGEFILEFARRTRGPFATSWGTVVLEEKMEVAYLNPLDRARLQQIEPLAGEHLRGFTFSAFGDDYSKYEELAVQVAALMPAVDAWLCHGELTEHIHPLRRSEA